MRHCAEARFRMPAALCAVSAIVGHVRSQLGAGLPFRCELLLREALVNAVVHGGEDLGRREVFCVVRSNARGILILVEDTGAGFDWQARSARRSDPSAPGGRGLEILCRYATRVRFNRRGNRVVVWKRWDKE